jgi:hypothetical protein
VKSARLALPRGERFERLCRGLAFVLPWLAGVVEITGTPAFSTDAAALRAFALVPVGFEGLVSAWFGALLALVPVGGKLLRAEFVATLGLGVSGFFSYRLSERLLSARGPGALTAPLALMAALGVTLGPSFVLEGSSPGGHALAAALALAALDVATARGAHELRRGFLLGVLSTATACESRWLALALGAALALQAALGALPSRRAVTFFSLGAVVSALPLLAQIVLFTWVPMAGAAPAAALLGASTPLQLAPVNASVVLGSWFTEMGLFGLVLSVVGIGFALFEPPSRRILLPLLAVLAVDLAFDAARNDPVKHDALLGVRLVASSGLGASGALALGRLISYLERARIAFARPASILLVVYGFTLTLVSAEDSARAAETRAHTASEAWTDEAFASLTAHSVVLLRSEPVLLRLLASQITRGSRPDVLLVPLERLERGGAATELLASERGLVPLVREMLLSGRPSEYALSALADARPTYVELDPAWDTRLTTHLVPQAFFTEFAPQPQGRSDRSQDLARGDRAFSRVRNRLKGAEDGDPATRSVLARSLVERALILAALGDREPALEVVDALLRLDPRARGGLELRNRLQKPGKGKLDVSGLYASR